MTDDGGCDECPENTYNPRFDDTVKACTPCPDNKISPPGSSSADDCKEKGRKTSYFLNQFKVFDTYNLYNKTV